jgi:DNA-binding HxlR family transcriptional regulator
MMNKTEFYTELRSLMNKVSVSTLTQILKEMSKPGAVAAIAHAQEKNLEAFDRFMDGTEQEAVFIDTL